MSSLVGSFAIRRLPLVEDGRMVGVLTTDDLLIDVAANLGDLVRPITGQVLSCIATRLSISRLLRKLTRRAFGAGVNPSLLPLVA